MKKNYIKLLAFLFAGCLWISGCGDNTPPGTDTEETKEQEQEQNEAQEEDSSEAQTETESTDTSAESSASSLITPDTGNSTVSTTSTASGTELSSEELAHAELLTGERHSVVGIITDATQYSVAIQTPEGISYYLTIPETGVTGNLNYITVGQIATFTYVGSLDENHATLVDISDSSLLTGIYVEEYAFAIKIINAAKAMDLEKLSDLTNFPVFLNTGNYSGPINTSGEFEAISNEKIFTEALVNRLANYNLFELEYTDAGFVMGKGTPSITFDVDDDGILGIIGINSPAPPAAEDQNN